MACSASYGPRLLAHKSYPSSRCQVFLTKDRDICLGDFGLARRLSSDDLASSIVGTTSYICPELLADIPYGSKSDIWSLGCCIYEMSTHKPAFKAFTGELLRHPHLQPYVLNIHIKHNSPRRNSFPIHWHKTNYMKKNRFSEPAKAGVSSQRKKWFFCGGDRTLNPSVSEPEHEHPFSHQTIKNNPSFLDRRMEELSVGSTHEVMTSVTKRITSKASSLSKNAEVSAKKHSPTSKRPGELPKNCELIPVSRTSVKRSVSATRRASLPLANKVEVRESGSRPSLEGSSKSPQGDCSIMKDKCTVEVLGKSIDRLRFSDAWQGFGGSKFAVDREAVSERSDQNTTAGASSPTSSGLRHRHFDMSSHQQRAEALEGLLEFSARLLQEERFEELGVLLKPFGPAKVSPRETAIRLTKTFKDSTARFLTAQPT